MNTFTALFKSTTDVMVPHSEEWRYSWSIRTCISAAVISFLFLYEPTEIPLVEHFIPPFCVFVVIAVKDVTVGASIVNAWACIWGTFIGCAILSVILYILQPQISSWNSNQCTGILLLFLFLSSFVMQYIEIQSIGKKMGVSFLPVVIMSMNNPNVDHQKQIWNILNSVLLGSAVAMVGTLFPLPFRMAGTEVRERLDYFTNTITSLLQNASYSWLIQPVRAVDYFHMPFPNMFASKRVDDVGDRRAGNTMFAKWKHSRWCKIRMIISGLQAFKRSRHYRIGWIHRSHHRAKDLYTRIEIIKFLQEELEVLVKRNVEARFGPNRTASIRIFGRFVSLSRNFLSILLNLEKQVQDLETQSIHYPIYRCFFFSPNFRRRYTALVAAICTGYMQLHRVLLVEDFRNDEKLIVDAMIAMHAIVETKDLFNREYFRLRKSVYYNLHTSSMPTFGNTNIAKNRNNIFSEVVEILKPVEENSSTGAQPVVSEVLFNMNTVIFLIEAAADMIVMFWNEEELDDAEAIVRYLRENGQAIVNSRGLTPTIAQKSFRLSTRSSIELFSAKSLHQFQRPPWKPRPKGVNRYLSLPKWVRFTTKAAIGIWNDLFPAQSHLLCLKLDNSIVSNSSESEPGASSGNMWERIVMWSHWIGRWKLSWQWSPAIEERLKCAFTVALAMTLGGAFGIYANRPQAVMASFTIAYLAGGTVSGINIMACLNRSAGTVIACVYAVTCVFIVELTGMTRVPGLARLFIGLAIVLFQFPATYVRSFPLYSYTGTCGGFTVGLLLIDYFRQEDLTVFLSVHRIVDTFIAVFIYLAVELGLFAQMSEVTLISVLQKVIAGIDQRFLSVYSHIVPTSSYRKPLKKSTVATSNSTNMTKKEDLRKLLDLDSMQSLIIRQRDLLPFYKSEPRFFSAPVLPDRLLQETLHWQEQAVMNLQVMMWVVQSCDDDLLYKQEHRIAEITTVIADIPDAITGSALDKSQLKLINPMVLERRRSLSTPLLVQDDSAETLLLPLEKQYREVEVYISQALSFLSLSIQQLQQRPQDVPLEPVIRIGGEMKYKETSTVDGKRLNYELSGDIEMGKVRNLNPNDAITMQRIQEGQISVGGGLVINNEDESIVPLDPVSQLRRIHQARNLHLIHEQHKQRREKIHRTRNRSSSQVKQSSPSSNEDSSQQKDPLRKFTEGPTDHNTDDKVPGTISRSEIRNFPIDSNMSEELTASNGTSRKESVTVSNAEVEPSIGEAAKLKAIPRRHSSAADAGNVTTSYEMDAVRDRRASSAASYSSGPGTPRSRKYSTEDPKGLEYIFFAEVESHQVECLFSSYQQLLENIQENIMEHQILSAHEDIVVLGGERKAQSDFDKDHPLTDEIIREPQSTHPESTNTHSSRDLQHSSFYSPSSYQRPLSPSRQHLDQFQYHQYQKQNLIQSQNPQHKNLRSTQTVLRISSNKEIKVVNTLLNSTRNLLQALRSLSRVISRLQAHRDIRWTQDARKLA
jgi:hypothetical protein